METTIAADILSWLKNGQKCDKDGVPTCVKLESDGLYSFELLKPELHQMWLDEIQNIKRFYKNYKIPMENPNSQNKHGILVDNFGFYGVIQEMVQRVVIPLAKKLWSGVGEDTLHMHNAFTVDYHKTKDKNLELHVDDSEVTVNICLGS